MAKLQKNSVATRFFAINNVSAHLFTPFNELIQSTYLTLSRFSLDGGDKTGVAVAVVDEAHLVKAAVLKQAFHLVAKAPVDFQI